MNTFPMIARCMERQWAGYRPDERASISALWENRQAPGSFGSQLQGVQLIWYSIPSWTFYPPAEYQWMSIKTDYVVDSSQQKGVVPQ